MSPLDCSEAARFKMLPPGDASIGDGAYFCQGFAVCKQTKISKFWSILNDLGDSSTYSYHLQ